jgi:hypothetical protein
MGIEVKFLRGFTLKNGVPTNNGALTWTVVDWGVCVVGWPYWKISNETVTAVIWHGKSIESAVALTLQ